MTRISGKGIVAAVRAYEAYEDAHQSTRDVIRAAITAYLDVVEDDLSRHEPSDAAWKAAKLAHETTVGPAKLAEAIRAAYEVDGVTPVSDPELAKYRAAAASELAAAASDPAPDGWRMVPVDPTQEMMMAFSNAVMLWQDEVGEDEDVYHAMLAAAPEPPVSDGWRDIASAPSAKPVLVAYKNRCDKWRVVKAVRYEQYQNEQPADDDEGECGEYCEEKDAYFVRAGWYELIDNWDDFGFVSIYEGEPVAWQPLPGAPKGKENE